MPEGSLAATVNRYLLAGGPANTQPLRPALTQALARNGFVIDRHSGQQNFFGVQGLQEDEDTYTQNIRSSIPSFVTLDAGRPVPRDLPRAWLGPGRGAAGRE